MLLLVALAVSCGVIAWLRIPVIARDTFWAEDGRTFISSAAWGGPSVLFQPYGGYLHTVPRLVAAAVVLLPVSWWALATTATACAIAGALAVVVFVCARDLVPWLPARCFIAGLTVIAPLAPREVLGNLANLHSVFLWTLFWIVLARPRRLRSAIVLSIVAFLGAMTEIQALFLAPLLLVRSRDRLVWVVRAGVIAGLVVQLVVTVGWPRAANTNPGVDPLSIAYGYLINAVMPLAVPQSRLGAVLASTGPAVGIAVLAVIAAGVVYVMVRGTHGQRLLAVAALSGSVLIYVASVATNPNTFYDYARLSSAQLSTVWLTRYGVVPSMLLALVLPLAAAIAFGRRHRLPALSWSVVAVAAVSVALIAAQLGPQWTRRSDGPAWQPQLAAAFAECRSDDELRFVNLKETIGWKVTVPCVDLTGRADADR
ncbi:hypothetical protein ASF88_01135 [Leifsonia sp. Leaf336]|uniref:hypothetical protein n=1 Tax=Leifsonia sp. Leaf336 TaxID=1736341 RepID=UPI0006FD22A1|nr:hypothetical protein [Leifsonia sp. Leaf336]KQR53517.1 hypothetical protein ASF88_01135 [Leifsonia sp. Leaf336]